MIDYVVFPCELKEIKDFVEKWHYSKSVNGIKIEQCFKLLSNDMIGMFRNANIIGAIIFGELAMGGVKEKYIKEGETITELRRLCCIDDTPKNTESFFISKCLKWLKKNTIFDYVISYADENHGHQGGIYKATNFDYLGITAPSRMIDWNGKLYHDKATRVKYNGKLKPFSRKLKTALEKGSAFFVDTKFKHIFLYNLRRRKQWNNSCDIN